jgi:hypothetical protein
MYMLNFPSSTSCYLQNISSLIHEWSNKGEYLQDMRFLGEIVWPIVEHDHIAHDAYCCEKFRDTRPFSTKRYLNYQHVGQVFDSHDQPRMDDIDNFMPDWVFG